MGAIACPAVSDPGGPCKRRWHLRHRGLRIATTADRPGRAGDVKAAMRKASPRQRARNAAPHFKNCVTNEPDVSAVDERRGWAPCWP